MKPDVIVSWPRNCDYPLWRQYIRENRTLFNEIIVAFTETHHGDDYRHFVKNETFKDHVQCFDAPLPKEGEDWRNVAIHSALIHSYNADFIWFTEQDFFPHKDFWPWVHKQNNSIFGVMQGTRLHPCCILINRRELEKTSKDFSANAPEWDHFGKLQIDFENMGMGWQVIPNRLYTHFNGLSHNFRLIAEGNPPNYQADAFYKYLRQCLRATVPLSAQFEKTAQMGLLHEKLQK